MTIFGSQTAIPKHSIDQGELNSSLLKSNCVIIRPSLLFGLNFATNFDSVEYLICNHFSRKV